MNTSKKTKMPVYVSHRELARRMYCHSVTLTRRLRKLGIAPSAVVCNFGAIANGMLYDASSIDKIIVALNTGTPINNS